MLGTLPLFRNRVMPQQFGIKYDGVGLDARLDTDLSLLEPNKLIIPNELCYIRTEIPKAAAEHQGQWTIEASGMLAAPTVLKLDDALLTLKLTPNLAHGLSVYGIARELAALTGAPLKTPAIEPVV